jgi:short-subunit dehydrogenase
MKNILITGVSSGIGEAIAQKLLQSGFKVFGTYRTIPPTISFKTSAKNQFIPVKMDVCDENSIQEAFQQIKETLNGEALFSLINNSGVAQTAPLEMQSLKEIREMFEVNVFGLIRVTQTFLPLMKQSGNEGAKIINMSSGAGKLNIPFLGAYVASKHALEGLSGSLRRELMPFGIDVIVVGPGNVITPIWEKVKRETKFVDSDYKEVHEHFFNFMISESKKGMLPEEIAEHVQKIIRSKKPEVRYAPVAQKIANWYLPRLLPDRTMDKMIFKMLKMKVKSKN